MRARELDGLLGLASFCRVSVESYFLTVLVVVVVVVVPLLPAALPAFPSVPRIFLVPAACK